MQVDPMIGMENLTPYDFMVMTKTINVHRRWDSLCEHFRY